MNKILQPVLIGLILGTLTIFMAEVGGMSMGKNEDEIKNMLKGKAAAAVLDAEQAAENSRKAWSELKRAHSHAEGLGVIVIALSFVLAFTQLIPQIKTLLSAGLGLGGMLYPATIYLAAMRMPAMGEEAARESLELMVVGVVGLFMLCLSLTLLYLFYVLVIRNRPGFLKGIMKED